MIFFKDVVEFLVSGGVDYLDFVVGKQWFDQVSSIDLVVRCCFCIDNGVDFINKQDVVGILFQLFE